MTCFYKKYSLENRRHVTETSCIYQTLFSSVNRTCLRTMIGLILIYFYFHFVFKYFNFLLVFIQPVCNHISVHARWAIVLCFIVLLMCYSFQTFILIHIIREKTRFYDNALSIFTSLANPKYLKTTGLLGCYHTLSGRSTRKISLGQMFTLKIGMYLKRYEALV